jgi:glutamate-1-semialdehyde 2,1-aminomutase
VSSGGAQASYGVTPDLTTMGKVIGGGFPVGAVGGRADVMAVFDPRSGQPKVPHGGTFNANPITMVAGLVTMNKLTPEAFARLEANGIYLRQGLGDALKQAGVPGWITGAGSLFGIAFGEEPASDFRTWLGSERERAWRGQIYRSLLAGGAIVAPHLVGCLSTPMTRAELDGLIEGVSDALQRLEL